ncbi:MAG: hypothetical protein RLW61_17435 [Gammaproteobacteria bacterium]
MAITDAYGLPIAVCVESASPHEVTLVDKTIEATFLEYASDRLIGDRAYDSDALDETLLRECGIDLVAPHRHALRIFPINFLKLCPARLPDYPVTSIWRPVLGHVRPGVRECHRRAPARRDQQYFPSKRTFPRWSIAANHHRRNEHEKPNAIQCFRHELYRSSIAGALDPTG